MNTQRFCPLHSRFVKLHFPFDWTFRTKFAGRRVLFTGSANLPELNLTEMPFWHPRFCKPNPGPTESLNYKSLRSLSKNFRSVSQSRRLQGKNMPPVAWIRLQARSIAKQSAMHLRNSPFPDLDVEAMRVTLLGCEPANWQSLKICQSAFPADEFDDHFDSGSILEIGEYEGPTVPHPLRVAPHHF